MKNITICLPSGNCLLKGPMQPHHLYTRHTIFKCGKFKVILEQACCLQNVWLSSISAWWNSIVQYHSCVLLMQLAYKCLVIVWLRFDSCPKILFVCWSCLFPNFYHFHIWSRSYNSKWSTLPIRGLLKHNLLLYWCNIPSCGDMGACT